MSKAYYRVDISITYRRLNHIHDKYQLSDEERPKFSTLKEAKKFIKERYGKQKRERVYIDDENKKPIHIGYAYHSKSSEYDGRTGKSNWFQQIDWVNIVKVTEEYVK